MATLPRPDLLIIDEAHHAVAAGYKRIVEHWKGAYTLGVTATPSRLDGKGLSDVFQKIVMGPSMRELQDRGYLARYDYFAPPLVADFSNLKKRGSDFAAEAVAAAVDRRAVYGDAEKHYRKLLGGKPAIGFLPTVATAEHAAQEFRAAGWKASYVDGTMDDRERTQRIKAVGTGELNLLFNVDVLSEGTDLPDVYGCLDLARTESLVKFLQRDGRTLRLKKDGSRAVLVDHVGNIHSHGEPNAPRNWSLDGAPKRAQASALRTCTKCYLAHAPCPQCPNCGFVYQVVAPIRAAARVVDGDLKQVKEDSYLQTTDLKTLLKAAQTREQLVKIAQARGYKPGWVQIQWAMKTEGRNGTYGGRTGWDRHAS